MTIRPLRTRVNRRGACITPWAIAAIRTPHVAGPRERVNLGRLSSPAARFMFKIDRAASDPDYFRERFELCGGKIARDKGTYATCVSSRSSSTVESLTYFVWRT